MRLDTVAQTKQIITLENADLQLTIRPDCGGRIDQLHDRRTGHDWLWHPETYIPSQARSLPLGASFDDHWTGGWAEIFPSQAGGEFRGRDLVDHGELWSQAWDVVEASQFYVKLTYQCHTVPISVEKSILLSESQPEAKIGYRFQNHSKETIPFLFKQQAAIAIAEGDEILLPDCLIEPALPEFSKIIGQAKKTKFPKALAADGQEIEVHQIPPRSSKLQEFYYSSNLALGMCGIRRRDSQTSLVMRFDTSDFPYVWVFQSYGGWQDHYVVVLEPCTTIPADLETAYQNGTTAQLRPQERQYRTMTIRLSN